MEHTDMLPFLQVKTGNPMWNPLHEHYTYMKMSDIGMSRDKKLAQTKFILPTAHPIIEHYKEPTPVQVHKKYNRSSHPTAHPIMNTPTAHPITMHEGYSYPMYTYHDQDDRMSTEQPVYILQHPHQLHKREYHHRLHNGYQIYNKPSYELPDGNIYKSIPL